MLTELSYSALTDVILACLQAFAAGVWTLSMTLIALTFLLGAIDHGFLEPVGHWLHEPLKTAARVSAAVTSFFICATAALQFLDAGKRNIVYIVSAGINAAVIVALFLSDNFFIVMGSYSAAMLFLLALNVMGLKKGTGSLAMISGIVMTFVASSLPLVGFELFPDFGIYATYHVVLMPAVLCFFLGGLKLKRQAV